MVNSMCGGGFYDLTLENCWVRLKAIAEDSFQNAAMDRSSRNSHKKGVHEIGTSFELPTKVEALTNKLDQFISLSLAPSQGRTANHLGSFTSSVV